MQDYALKFHNNLKHIIVNDLHVKLAFSNSLLDYIHWTYLNAYNKNLPVIEISRLIDEQILEELQK